MTLIKIEGKRHTGKTTLLGHYIQDAQKKGMKVLLTGKNLMLCKLVKKLTGVSADLVTTGSSYNHKGTFDILAVEESDASLWKMYHFKYAPLLSKNVIITITGDLE